MGRRGTTNTNVRGSAADRRKRKWWLIETHQHPEFGAGWTSCCFCKALLCYETVTVDRIKPGCQGGTYRRENIRPACGRCNSETGATLRSSIVPGVRRELEVKIDEQVRQLHPPRYTRSQAAELVGRNLDTLKRWKRKGIYVPSESRVFGQLVVDLYTDEDIQEMRKIAKGMKPGPSVTKQ